MMMKTRDEIAQMLMDIDTNARTKYPGMTYEQGVEEALSWVLGEMADGEFDPTPSGA